MNIAIIGLGYVGCVSAACLAKHGHHVTGIDVNTEKVEQINRGQSPIIEPNLDFLVREMVEQGRLTATLDVTEAVIQTEICLICVGTPSENNGDLNCTFVERVLTQVGSALKTNVNGTEYKVIALRSTLLPGVLEDQLLPLLARVSGQRPGIDFGVAVNPEFLREGCAIEDFEKPPLTLIGTVDPLAGEMLSALYADIPAPIYRVTPGEACMVKYASNAFHALKVTFANEINRLCEDQGLDSGEVMRVFCQDSKLNISSRYLRPGFAFGGSCLPKDLRALLYMARHHDVDVPVLEAVLPSNQLQIDRAYKMIQRTGQNRVAIIGLSFKPDTDDLRESPIVLLAETLIGKGYQVRIYDQNVNLSRLIGGNRAYIEQLIPHIAALTYNTLEEALHNADIVIAAHGVNAHLHDQLTPGQTLIDLSQMAVEMIGEVEAAYGS